MQDGIQKPAVVHSAGAPPAAVASISAETSRARFTTQGQTPHEILSTYCEDDWEIFVEEAMYGAQPPYASIQRFRGSGDKGRDVACFATEPSHSSLWDNFQCKHYLHPLHRGDKKSSHPSFQHQGLRPDRPPNTHGGADLGLRSRCSLQPRLSRSGLSALFLPDNCMSLQARVLRFK